jgi:hypothetical protein
MFAPGRPATACDAGQLNAGDCRGGQAAREQVEDLPLAG